MDTITCVSHIRSVLEPSHNKLVIDRIKKLLKLPEYKGVKAIAVRGLSGIIIGSIIANKLKMNLIVVRKEREECHSCHTVEGRPKGSYKYVIIDDLISSGITMEKIYFAIKNCANDDGVTVDCAGIILYHQTLTYPKYQYNKHTYTPLPQKPSDVISSIVVTNERFNTIAGFDIRSNDEYTKIIAFPPLDND